MIVLSFFSVDLPRFCTQFLFRPMLRFLISHLSVLVLGLGLLVSSAFAQSPQQSQTSNQQRLNQPSASEPDPVDASAEEITQVATLLVDVEQVRQKYQMRLSETQDVEKAKEIQSEMAGAIDETLQSADEMSPERYQEIVEAAQSNPNLQQSIMAEVDKERRSRNGHDG